MALTKEQLTALKTKLEASKKDLTREIASLAETPEFGTDVDHFEEETDEAEEYSKNLGVGKALKERLMNVEHALEKMGKRTYGTCERCKKDIEWEILNIDPESRYCHSCKALGAR